MKCVHWFTTGLVSAFKVQDGAPQELFVDSGLALTFVTACVWAGRRWDTLGTACSASVCPHLSATHPHWPQSSHPTDPLRFPLALASVLSRPTCDAHTTPR